MLTFAAAVLLHRTKQFYMFIQKEWIEGDPGQPPPPPERKNIRNKDWKHMHVEDILSMPDKWEYPFFAIWDSVRVLCPCLRRSWRQA